MGASERERAVALSLLRGNAFDRRQWRRKGERVGAAVGDWQGGSAAADRAGHRKGESLRPRRRSRPIKASFRFTFLRLADLKNPRGIVKAASQPLVAA